MEGLFVGEDHRDFGEPVAFAFQPELDELRDGGAALGPHQFQMPVIAGVLVEGWGDALLQGHQQVAG